MKSDFIKDDRAGLEQILGKVSKYRFIIERASSIFCRSPRKLASWKSVRREDISTSYFILGGRRILGVDVSPDAVEQARRLTAITSQSLALFLIEEQGLLSPIYHLGLIGCVEDPIGLTMVSPGPFKTRKIAFCLMLLISLLNILKG